MGRIRSFAALLAIATRSERVASFNSERRNPKSASSTSLYIGNVSTGPSCRVSHRDTCSIPTCRARFKGPLGDADVNRRRILVRVSALSARASRTISEEDLFDDDSYFGGKSYGQGRASAVRRRRESSRDDRGKGNRNIDIDEEAAWDQLYEESNTATFDNDDDAASADDEIDTNTLPPTHSSHDFHARTAEAVDILRRTARSVVSEQTWRPEQLDAEKDDLPASSSSPSWRQYQTELQSAVDLVSYGLVERSEESRLVVLGMVAGEHVLFLGPPGTGKSQLGRRLSSICGGQFFQRLLTRFTTPEEIFGPLSLKALENDEYKRCTNGFLPTASVAFLDEIFKANSAILNTLLTILNERKFDNGAGIREDCPVRCVVGASNELPEDEELDALYDRFLLRKLVRAVSDEGLAQLLSAIPSDDEVPSRNNVDQSKTVFTDGLEEVSTSLAKAANAVTVTDDICIIMRNLRTFMKEELDVDVSDRRLVRAARLLRLSAASHGRTVVDPIDCLLLQHIVWRLPEQRAAVRQWLWDNLTPGGDGSAADVLQFRFLLNGLRQSIEMAVRSTGGDVTGNGGAKSKDVAAIAALREEVSRLSSLIQCRLDLLVRHAELLKRAPNHCWLDPNEAKSAQQLLLPKAKRSVEAIKQTLLDARALELALLNDLSSPTDDVRVSTIESLWEAEQGEIIFSEDELNMNMKDAKQRYDDPDTFRAWKRAKKKMRKKG